MGSQLGIITDDKTKEQNYAQVTRKKENTTQRHEDSTQRQQTDGIHVLHN